MFSVYNIIAALLLLLVLILVLVKLPTTKSVSLTATGILIGQRIITGIKTVAAAQYAVFVEVYIHHTFLLILYRY